MRALPHTLRTADDSGWHQRAGDRDRPKRRGNGAAPAAQAGGGRTVNYTLNPPLGATSTQTRGQQCTRGITPEHAAKHAHIDGDQRLATAALQMVSIIWSPPNPEAFGQF